MGRLISYYLVYLLPLSIYLSASSISPSIYSLYQSIDLFPPSTLLLPLSIHLSASSIYPSTYSLPVHLSTCPFINLTRQDQRTSPRQHVYFKPTHRLTNTRTARDGQTIKHPACSPRTYRLPTAYLIPGPRSKEGSVRLDQQGRGFPRCYDTADVCVNSVRGEWHRSA